jgi:hypothetical protein
MSDNLFVMFAAQKGEQGEHTPLKGVRDVRQAEARHITGLRPPAGMHLGCCRVL